MDELLKSFQWTGETWSQIGVHFTSIIIIDGFPNSAPDLFDYIRFVNLLIDQVSFVLCL